MYIEKVTAFITRPSTAGLDLLLFRHPHAGIQIPAGTVEAGETVEQAVLRETAEETGLMQVAIRGYLGVAEEVLPLDRRIVVQTTKVYTRPRTGSASWAYLPRGIVVDVRRTKDSFVQVSYVEYDQIPDAHYVTLSLVGWVVETALADRRRRHFYHLELNELTEDSWTVQADSHEFSLFWAPLSALPEIIYPQNEWLAILRAYLLSSLEQKVHQH